MIDCESEFDHHVRRKIVRETHFAWLAWEV